MLYFYGLILVEAGLQDSVIDPSADLSANKETAANLVIPEKASSFAIHPDRLCQDQCFYCGGKFGIYDTPCHIAQIKSVERQKKILDSKFFKISMNDKKIKNQGKNPIFFHDIDKIWNYSNPSSNRYQMR